MRQNLILAVSVLALTTVSQPLFAAETEMAAPQERAAPARRAQPQRAAPQRQAPQQQASQTNSFTGAQAGGFGGGNAGGGSFADPICQSTFGLNLGCTPISFNQSTNHTGGIGGGVMQWMVPVSPWIMVGIMGDLSGGKTTSTTSQSFTYADSTICCNQITTANYTNTVSQGTSGSVRFKAGLVMPVAGWYTSIMPYVTVGWIRTRFDGTFNFASSNFNSFQPSCSFNPSCSSIASSSFSWSQSANGVVYGVGVDIPLPAFGPGFVLVLDYSRADFQSFDITAPVALATACIPGPSRSCAVTDTLHVSHQSSNKFTGGIRFKFM
jgi:hypothetical protein